LRPLKSTLVLRTSAALFSAYARLTLATLRWTREGQEIAQAHWARGGGVILCIWHHTIPLSPATWPARENPQPMRALISRSKDGEFISQVMERLGFGAIRGSSKKQTDLAKNKNGEAAFREMVRWVREGNAVAVTPDGPRGPAMQMQKGVAALARATGAPVLMVGLACAPAARLNSWDRTLTPLPFSRAAMVWGEAVHAGRDDDADAVTLDWTERMRSLDARANALVGNEYG
jgi:lysophospholipid acyltransferase (LPLAT)-like uncharacterized protein